MPLKPPRPLCETVRHEYHSKVWYAATELGTGEELVTYRRKRDCDDWVSRHNADSVRDALDEVDYWRPRRVLAALEYLARRRLRQSQSVSERGAQLTLAF